MKRNNFPITHRFNPYYRLVLAAVILAAVTPVGLAYSAYAKKRDDAAKLRLTTCFDLTLEEQASVLKERRRKELLKNLSEQDRSIMGSR